MQFTVEFQADHLISALAAIRHTVEAPALLLENIGEALFRVNQERHDQGLDPEGQPWKPLSPLTIGTAAARGYDKAQGRVTANGHLLKNGTMSLHRVLKVRERKARLGILRETGDMLGDLHYQVEGVVLRLGFDDPKALWHHAGTKPYEIRPKVAKALSFAGMVVKRVHHPGLPARPLLGFPASDQRLTEEVTAHHLTAVLNRLR